MAGTCDGTVTAGGVVDRPVDAAVVARLVDDLGADHVAEVCAMFLADARGLVDAVRAAHEEGDAAAAASMAHRLKSSAGFVGAAGISGLCREIEVLTRDRRLADLGPRVEVLAREVERVAAELTHLVG